MTAVNLTEADPADEDADVEGVVVEEEPVDVYKRQGHEPHSHQGYS